MITARNDPNITTPWNVSVHITALIPPWFKKVVTKNKTFIVIVKTIIWYCVVFNIIQLLIYLLITYDGCVNDAHDKYDSACQINVDSSNWKNKR